jgi:precorrin-3B synthase
VFDPLLTGDGWLVRIRCPGGILTPAGLRLVAELAAANGSGQVELTSRANLQLRGLREEALDATGRELVAVGLAAADANRDGWRALVTSPLAGHDPEALVDTAPLVAALVTRLATEVDGPPPAKFGIVIDDGGSWPLDRLDADLRLGPAPGGRWSVALRGVGYIGAADDPEAAALATARLCAAEGRRIDGVVEARGLSSVRAGLGATPANCESTALPPTRAARRSVSPEVSPSRSLSTSAHEQRDPLTDRVGRGSTTARDDRPGVRDHHEPDRCSLVAAPFLGRLDATTLVALARLAEQDAQAVRLTTARSVALCGLHRDRLDAVRAELMVLGLLTTATDARARLSACVGSRGCEAARADTWAEAERLAGAGSGRVHLSGCDKACGAPQGVRHLVAVDGGHFVERTVTA